MGGVKISETRLRWKNLEIYAFDSGGTAAVEVS